MGSRHPHLILDRLRHSGLASLASLAHSSLIGRDVVIQIAAHKLDGLLLGCDLLLLFSLKNLLEEE